MATNTLTLFRFDASIDRASLEVEGRTTRFRLVDVGDRTLILEMAAEPGDGEKLGVRVRYKDGATPAYATFVLVSHPTLVDKEVEVVRRPRTVEALEARVAHMEAELVALKAQCAQSGLPNLAFSGLLDSTDVRAKPFWGKAAPGYRGSLEPGEGIGYRATRWAMVVVSIRNLPGQPAWAPGTARLTSTTGTPVKVLSVHLEKPRLLAGESALAAVLVEPPASGEGLFQLELVDAEGGRLFPITKIAF